ncbi:MAG TPA: ribonuclease E activity regulator RraA [Actinomycetota bacterium]
MVATADLCDRFPDARVAEPILRDFGGSITFSGSIATVRVFEDNVLVRAALEQPGNGQVLVIDGGGSLRCALVGDQIAGLAHSNGWSGLVVHGCIRDSDALALVPIGVKALETHPRKSQKRGDGERDVPVTFAGLTFGPGDVLFADEDGLVVLDGARIADI